ncbi:hypothetical protein M9H77_26304 [Catharanthus roseus]|uniref:Uncharacterized protein n=1 Tax=Catharanthus roseus TaxID=4058 RepID=A0ACC0ADC5_CATRO|nr:hypothetical protein M9H77_26304 [Catharanthus roseus]
MVGAVQPHSSYCTHGYTAGDYGVSSSKPFMGRQSADLRFEGDRGLGEEPDRVRSLHIGGEKNERADDNGDGDGDDNDDDGEDAGDEEQPVPMAHVVPASGSDGWPRHGKGKGLTGSRDKRTDKALDVPAPTQRKRVKGGPVDPELIPSYGGLVAGPIWRGQDRGLLKCRSRYMALKGWSLTDAEVVLLATGTGLMHLHSCMFQHPNSALLSAFVERC